MGCMFRSESMVLAHLYVQQEATWTTVGALGDLGVCQFRDKNKHLMAFQKKFVDVVKLCQLTEYHLEYLETLLRQDNIAIEPITVMPELVKPSEIFDLSNHIESMSTEVKHMEKTVDRMKKSYAELQEMKYTLEYTLQDYQGHDDDEEDFFIYNGKRQRSHVLNFIAGVIARERFFLFEKMIWRMCKGQVFIKKQDIVEPFYDIHTKMINYKNAFMIYFQGDHLKEKLTLVAVALKANLYNCPTNTFGRTTLCKMIANRMKDLNTVLLTSYEHKHLYLIRIAKQLSQWQGLVLKVKATSHILNHFQFDVSRSCLIGECWIPTAKLPAVYETLAKCSGQEECDTYLPCFLQIIQTQKPPPTLIKTNKFTAGFQTIIDSYGVSTYEEVNPAVYSIITFPFLFGVMFGDCGHALIMIIFACYLIGIEKKKSAKSSTSEIFCIFFAGRYMILLMGFFSLYVGLIYNEIFSKSFNLFGSSWHIKFNISSVISMKHHSLDPRTDYSGTPYVLGIDPAWQLAHNKIIFLNSYKMKVSIVIAIVHMAFGVCLNIPNFLHSKQYARIFLEFIPQLLLLLTVFLWLAILIIIKWIIYSAGNPDVNYGELCAPKLLVYFIDMLMLRKTKPISADSECQIYIFALQPYLQYCLVAVFLLCIPVLFLGMPVYKMLTKEKDETESVAVKEDESILFKDRSAVDVSHEGGTSDVFIFQAIHTVEMVLGTVSHTASYLRLWALSLAHGQLSEVLWSKMMGTLPIGPTPTLCILLILRFHMWMILTVAILIIMEGLSAFLHTLRLHWVEFMSKFYSGDGHKFHPFRYKTIFENHGIMLNESDDSEDPEET